jgi:hypothetical protein
MENKEKSWVRVSCVSAEIRSKYFSHMSLANYRYARLLRKMTMYRYIRYVVAYLIMLLGSLLP